MTRKNRSLIVSLILLGLAAAALLVVRFTAKSDNDASSPALQRPDQFINLLIDDLRRVHLENPSGVLDITSSDGQTWFLSDTPPHYRALPDKLRRTVQTLLSLRPMEVIAENATEAELEAYGLNKPRAMVSFKDKDGNSSTVEFGDRSPSGSGRYGRIAGSAKVSLIPSYSSELAFSDASDYRDMSLPQVNIEKLATVELRHNGRVFRSEPGTIDSPYVNMMSDGLVVSPWRGRYALDDYKLRSILSEESPLPLNALAYLDELSPEDAELGLSPDDADRIFIEDGDGAVLDLYIGNSDNQGHRYARLGEKDDAVFLLNDKDIRLVETDPFTLTSKFLFLASISSVSQVKVVAANRRFLMERIERGDPDDTKDDQFKINSLEVPHKEFSSAYQKFIGIMWEGIAKEDVPLGSSDVQITVSHVNSGVEPAVVRFWDYDDVYYLAAVDGNPLEFLVGRYQVQDFIEDIAALSEYAS